MPPYLEHFFEIFLLTGLHERRKPFNPRSNLGCANFFNNFADANLDYSEFCILLNFEQHFSAEIGMEIRTKKQICILMKIRKYMLTL